MTRTYFRETELPTENFIPPTAQYYKDGMFYKIADKNFPFMHVGHDWVKSTKAISDIKRGDRL